MKAFRQQLDPRALPEVVRSKWPDDLLVEGFVPFPKRLLRVAKSVFEGATAIDDLRAVLAVVDFQRPNLRRAPSADWLAFVAGMPVAEFDQAILRLEAAGLAKVVRTADSIQVDLGGLARTVLEKTSDEP